MKKLLILSAATVIFAATVNAQITTASLNNEIKSDRRIEASLKKKKKKEKKELRMIEHNRVQVSYLSSFPVVNKFWVSLPVLETPVPQDVIVKLTGMFGSKLYDITAIKGPDNQDEYIVRIMQNDQMVTKTMGNK